MKRVMVFGTFDIVHLGHVFVWKQARRYGDYLIVVVARDERVVSLKHRAPVHSERERAELLKEFNIIDKVVLGDKDNVYAAIIGYRPDVIVLGHDQERFVPGLYDILEHNRFETEIVRLPPFDRTAYRSGRLREYMEQT